MARLHHFSPEGHGSVVLLVGFLRVKNAGCKGPEFEATVLSAPELAQNELISDGMENSKMKFP